MFDIGFLELVLISIVGLLVLGPERLPGAIRSVTLWVGRFRRAFSSLRTELEREVGADEIRRELHNAAIVDTFKDTLEDAEQDLDKLNREIQRKSRELESSLQYDVQDILQPQADAPANSQAEDPIAMTGPAASAEDTANIDTAASPPKADKP